MKKIITFIILLAANTFAAMAQEVDQTFVFVNKDGHTIADGSTVNAYATEDAFGSIMVNSDLFIKNNSADKDYVLVDYSVEHLPNGVFQICFPMNCIQKDKTGTWQTPATDMEAGQSVSVNSEWLPDDAGRYGTAQATYQLKPCVYNPLTKTYSEAANGPKVTVIFHYEDPTAITSIDSDKDSMTACYDMAGRRLSLPQKGLTILRMASGKTIKRYIP